jgi:hypothetical protein
MQANSSALSVCVCCKSVLSVCNRSVLSVYAEVVRSA